MHFTAAMPLFAIRTRRTTWRPPSRRQYSATFATRGEEDEDEGGEEEEEEEEEEEGAEDTRSAAPPEGGAGAEADISSVAGHTQQLVNPGIFPNYDSKVRWLVSPTATEHARKRL